MKTFLRVVTGTILALLALSISTNSFHTNYLAAEANSPAASAKSPSKKTMQAFHSVRELHAYLRALARKQQRRHSVLSAQMVPAPPKPAPDAAAAGAAQSASTQAEVTKSTAEESVTNVQHAGVDEGGIVKVHGDQLVMLRRGRLFTVSIAKGALEPISSIDAFGPDIDPSGTWYDEMLVSEDTVVVIGYSYERGGTEVGLFQIDPAGKLSYRSTYHLRSNDYYSSRNYASRLIGHKLIFYSPLELDLETEDVLQQLPAVRKWHKGATASEFRRIASATQIYRPQRPLDSFESLALHTVTVCDLAHGGFDCKATSVIGPPSEVFYVAPEAVYIWISDWVSEEQQKQTRVRGMVYRMPLNDSGTGPTALRVSGSPVDQFSFLESRDGYLNVLVRSETEGDGMWRAEVAEGDVALMRTPLASFSDGSEVVPRSSYRKLPKPEGDTFQNRFVGDYLLYGTGSGWGYQQKTDRSVLYAVRWAGGKTQKLALTHGTDRIEEMGSDAVVVGTDGTDLHFTAVRLGNWPEVADEYIRKEASQGELRSQGFFYKPDSADSGILGLPISVPARPGYYHLFENSAAILFLRNDALHFQEVGELEARPERAKDDGCRASCVDWYGNARPLFVHGRIIALLGYELVEGTLTGGRMQEMRRVSYAPQEKVIGYR